MSEVIDDLDNVLDAPILETWKNQLIKEDGERFFGALAWPNQESAARHAAKTKFGTLVRCEFSWEIYRRGDRIIQVRV